MKRDEYLKELRKHCDLFFVELLDQGMDRAEAFKRLHRAMAEAVLRHRQQKESK